MHSKELINMNVKEELEELIQFGMEIEYSAWNLRHHKEETKKQEKKANKKNSPGSS